MKDQIYHITDHRYDTDEEIFSEDETNKILSNFREQYGK